MRWILIGFLKLTLLVHAQSITTTVNPLPTENLASPCHYELLLPTGGHAVRAVWVIYDRGRDIMKFYSDPDVIAFAKQHHLALMMAHQCPAKNAPGGPTEMDMDAAHGIGRALFSALDQFAQQAGHHEISAAKLILLGFSGTGAMFAHFVGYAPERILACIAADPGHYDPVGVDNVRLPPKALEVPELVLSGGADKVSGTQRPYDYFRKYRDQGAPWAFLVQNRTPHCCIINTKILILEWLGQIIRLRQPSPTEPMRKIDQTGGWLGYIRTCPTDVRDSWGGATWNACDASIRQFGHDVPDGQIAAGWLPSSRVAQQWLSLVRQPTHPIDSLP